MKMTKEEKHEKIENEINNWNKFKDAVIACAIFDFKEKQLADYVRLTYRRIEEGHKITENRKKVTETDLLEIVKRLDKCTNHAQACFIFDSLPEEIKALLKEE